MVPARSNPMHVYLQGTVLCLTWVPYLDDHGPTFMLRHRKVRLTVMRLLSDKVKRLLGFTNTVLQAEKLCGESALSRQPLCTSAYHEKRNSLRVV
nr:hypothetical protein CFP56_07647 [Quercus suber]